MGELIGRDGTAEEMALYAPQPTPGAETWMGVIEEDGAVTGHICLSRALGQVFGHDTRSWSKDATGAVRLWLMARAKAREWGAKEVLVHFEQEDDPMKEFWTKRGFVPVMTIYRGAI